MGDVLMHKFKLGICEMEDGSGRYFVRSTSHKFPFVGLIQDTFEAAKIILQKCEEDPEYLYWAQRDALMPNTPQLYEAVRKKMTDMTKTEAQVFDYLYDGYDSDNCVQTFESLSCALSITVRQAKTACRRLKRRGYAEHSPYWNEYSGLLGGSGYTLTVAGIGEGRVRQRTSTAISENAGSRATAALTE
jgi:DNA-binding CsgD family transcriptional regulator